MDEKVKFSLVVVDNNIFFLQKDNRKSLQHWLPVEAVF